MLYGAMGRILFEALAFHVTDNRHMLSCTRHTAAIIDLRVVRQS